jgi:adenine-specific DNA-methyltransferase
VNYIGSKFSLLPFLEKTVDDVTGYGDKRGGVFADLFAGTGAVGSHFKKKGYKVIANDFQHYAFAINRHYIENVPPINSERIDWLNSLSGEDGFVFRNYCAGSGSGRNYFTDDNGRRCDAIRAALDFLLAQKHIGEDEYYYYLTCLLNSIDKVANTASVYGAYLKHIKPSAAKSLRLEPLPIINGERGKVFFSDISELIPCVTGDILYLDPPYNARQYCSNYHVLETISRYDNPKLFGATGLRDSENDKQKSAFCSKRSVASAFDNIIACARFKYIFLSYNNEGLMSAELIRDIMNKHGVYERFTQNYQRFRADKEEARNHKASLTTEYLHVCIK